MTEEMTETVKEMKKTEHITVKKQCVLSESNVRIEDSIFTAATGAYWIHEDGKPFHTFRTATVLCDGDNVTFKKCIFENSAGPGEENGQAIALYLDGDDIVVEDSIIIGNQDTLFLAPLPPKEYEKDGFLGPKQFTPRTMRHFTFRRCSIYGSVDFIFGGGNALFEDCDFISVAPGWVFAPCTPEGEQEGFVAKNCRFLHTEEVPEGSCYIARPWREYAGVKLINCYLDKHIAPAGWHDWGKTDAHETVRFIEQGSYGPGADNASRPEWVEASE